MLDLATDGAVRHVQLVGCQGHPSVPAGGFESTQRVEGRDAACHVSFPNNACSIISIFFLHAMMFSPAADRDFPFEGTMKCGMRERFQRWRSCA
jgi:hypothetical protein